MVETELFNSSFATISNVACSPGELWNINDKLYFKRYNMAKMITRAFSLTLREDKKGQHWKAFLNSVESISPETQRHVQSLHFSWTLYSITYDLIYQTWIIQQEIRQPLFFHHMIIQNTRWRISRLIYQSWSTLWIWSKDRIKTLSPLLARTWIGQVLVFDRNFHILSLTGSRLLRAVLFFSGAFCWNLNPGLTQNLKSNFPTACYRSE